MPNLSEILDSIVALRGISSTEGFHQHVYKTLDVRRLQKPATVNSHLMNPLNDESGGYSSRAIPLTGKEKVHGDYLSLHHPSSDTEITLLFYHETLEDLEAVILNDAGIFNPFTNGDRRHRSGFVPRIHRHIQGSRQFCEIRQEETV